MISSITPIARQPGGGWAQWIRSVAAYGIGSLLTSVSVGGLAAWCAQKIGGPWNHTEIVLIAFAIFLAFVELSPHPNRLTSGLALTWRQTRKEWRRRGVVQAGFLWGLDLGTGLSTRVNFVSFWLVLAAAFFSASVPIGMLIVGSYGLGRTIELATGPLFDRVSDGDSIVAAARTLFQSELTLHRFHAVMLIITSIGIFVSY